MVEFFSSLMKNIYQCCIYKLRSHLFGLQLGTPTSKRCLRVERPKRDSREPCKLLMRAIPSPRPFVHSSHLFFPFLLLPLGCARCCSWAATRWAPSDEEKDRAAKTCWSMVHCAAWRASTLLLQTQLHGHQLYHIPSSCPVSLPRLLGTPPPSLSLLLAS